MDKTSLLEIASMSGAKIFRDAPGVTISNINKDTRTIRPGDLYIGLRGENFDGNIFASQAIEKGAAAVLLDSPEEAQKLTGSVPVLLAENSLTALTNLAAAWRAKLDLKVLGITGSSGKTSTKEFAAAVLGSRFKVVKTQGNLNNHIGVPLSILAASSSDKAAVWEIGMNHGGEIEPLARLARPDIGIITNIGVAHIEFLGSREAIAREKGMLGEVLTAEASLVLAAGDEFTPSLAARTKARVVLVGGPDGVRAEQTRPSADGLDFDLVRGGESVSAHLPVTGEHMVRNALLAVTAGLELGLSLRECASGLAAAKLSKGRLGCLSIRGVTVLDDSYNANPDSMEAALHALRGLPGGGRRMAVLGRMGELGFYADEGYRRVGRAAAGTMDALIVVGEEAEALADEAEKAGGCEVRRVVDTSEAARLLRELARPGDAVVIKGSRAARMERVLEDFA